jgi:CheY-like chemotaxis protein
MLTVVNRFKKKKALLVEDHVDLLEILTWQMEKMGFSVISARRGKEGIEKAFSEKPHLILMDIMMPGMDGREATRRIRSNPETKNIPILAATVLYKESDLRSCLEAGCSDYIVKPFTSQELREKIMEHIPGE